MAYTVYIFSLTYPGSWIDDPDQQRAFRIKTLLHELENHFTEAVVSLNLFDSCRSIEAEQQRREAEWEKGVGAFSVEAFMKEMERLQIDHQGFEAAREQRRVAFLEDKYKAGIWPRSYLHSLPFLHARSFLYALHDVGKVLKVLSEERGIPKTVKQQRQLFASHFSSLTRVRDSLQHLEDRSRGLDRNKKPLQLKPVTNNLIHAPSGGVLALNCLIGTKFGCTMDDGHYGEVDVTCASLSVVQRYLQETLNSFRWKGMPRHYPE